MKDGAQYARRIKRLYNRLRRTEGKPEPGEPTEPIEQLIVSVLGVGSSQEHGRKALRKLLRHTVDINEIRVSSPGEITSVIKDVVPQASERAKALVAALNAVYHAENEVSLASLHTMGRREARQYLENLGSIDPYSIASIMLWSLGGHAIPVSDRVLAALRANDLVAPECEVATVQSFLERHTGAAEGPQFTLLMEKYAGQWSRSASSRQQAKDKPAKSKPAAKRTAKKSKRSTPRSSTSGRTKKTRSRS